MRASIAALAVILTEQSAAAVTADDVMKKMSRDERFGYVSGLIDMLSYQIALSGDKSRAKCVTDAFFRKKEDNEAWQKLVAAFERFPDRSAEAIVFVLMKQACGG
jgi:hypothetical protein